MSNEDKAPAYYEWEQVFTEVPLIYARLDERHEEDYLQELRRTVSEEQQMHGTPTHAIRAVLRKWLREREDYPFDYVYTVTQILWSTGIREERLAALGLTQFYEPVHDVVEFSLYEAWARDIDTWELADHLGALAGRMLEMSPRLLAPVTAWANNESPYLRRLAVATLSVASRDPNWEPGLAQMIERLAEDDEPVVKGAIEAAREKLQKAKARRA